MSATDDAFPPKWVLMEPFISRSESFPDERKAHITTSGTTSWKAPFSIALKLVKPPAISRMYAYLPGFPGGRGRQLVSLISTHQDLALFRVGKNSVSGQLPVQDLFVFRASDISLKRLPHCTFRNLADDVRCDGRQSRSTPIFPPPAQRMMSVATTGILCVGKEIVVAEANVLIKGPCNSEVYADLYWLQSSSPDLSGCQWSCARTRILSSVSTHDFRWQTYTVVPFRSWLCWIDYNCGILFGDMFSHTPTVTFVPLPPDDVPTFTFFSPMLPVRDELAVRFASGRPSNSPPNLSYRRRYRSVSAIEASGCLKFIKVDRHDGMTNGPLRGGDGFTITCHTLLIKDKVLEGKVWTRDYSVTSHELWSANSLEDLPRDILMFPQVNIDRPHVVHFLVIEKSVCPWKKMWVVTIDMNTKKVESLDLYINGKEAYGSEDADLVKEKSFGSLHFLPCGFSEFLQLSRKRKNADDVGRGSTSTNL